MKRTPIFALLALLAALLLSLPAISAAQTQGQGPICSQPLGTALVTPNQGTGHPMPPQVMRMAWVMFESSNCFKLLDGADPYVMGGTMTGNIKYDLRISYGVTDFKIKESYNTAGKLAQLGFLGLGLITGSSAIMDVGGGSADTVKNLDEIRMEFLTFCTSGASPHSSRVNFKAKEDRNYNEAEVLQNMFSVGVRDLLSKISRGKALGC